VVTFLEALFRFVLYTSLGSLSVFLILVSNDVACVDPLVV
jgi:hypothetical protein